MAYLGKTPSQAVRSRYYFTATGGETSLSGADDNSNTLTFTDGNYVDVALNGVTLVAGTDYNTTTANTIGGLTALVASDVVEVIVYDTFSVFGGNMAANLNFKDNVKANFGTGNDLQIYHDAGNSRIVDAGTGNLNLQADNNINILNNSGTEFKAQFITNGAVNLFYDNSKKLETTASGCDVTGSITADDLDLSVGTAGDGIQVTSTGANYLNLGFDTNRTGASQTLTQIEQKWNGTAVARISFVTGSDTTNKDDAEIRFQTASAGTPSTAMTVKSDGSVGIGTTSPARDLHINGTAASAKAFVRFTHDGLASTGLDVGYSSGGLASIYNAENTAMAFSTNATERMRILPTGGITFNGDTSTDNALSDYEVGSWNPRLRGSTGEPATLITGTGTYTKIGRLVTVTFAFSSISTTGYSGTLSVDQLTYSPSASFMAGGNAMFNLIATYPSGTSNICPYITQSSSSILFYGSENQAGWTNLLHNAGAAGRYLIGSVTYEAT